MFRSIVNQLGVRFLVIAFVTATMPMPAYAAMIGTDRAMTTHRTADDRAAVSTFLARDDVAQELKKYGVDPVQVQSRVAALTDQEIAQLNAQIQDLPAGAGVIWIIGAVVVVLIILELLGVTNVFTRI